MSDAVKNVIVKLNAQADASVKAGFDRISQGAQKAGTDMEQMAAKSGRGLKGLGGDLRTMDRGFRQLQGGVFGLLGSLSMMDERFSKPLAMFAVIHAGTQTVWGLSRAAPMASKALSMLASPLGIATMGFGGATAAALLFAKVLKDATRGTEEQRDALARLEKQGEGIRFAAGLGLLQPEQQARFDREQAIMAPHRERQMDLQDQMARAAERRAALMRHPENPFQDEHMQALRESSGELQKLLGGTQARFGPGQQAGAIGTEQERLLAMVRAPLGKQPLARRGIEEAKAAAQATEEWVQQLQRGKARVEELRASFLTLAEAQNKEVRVRALPRLIEESEEKLRFIRMRPGQDNAVTAAAQAEVQRLKDEQTWLRTQEGIRRPELNKAMRTIGQATSEGTAREEIAIAEAMKKAGADRLANQKALEEAQANLNRLQREELKGRQEIIKEGLKGTREFIQAEQNRLASLRQSMGLMDPEEQAKILQLAQKFSAGGKQQFSQDDLALAQKHGGLFGEKVGALGQTGFEGSPALQEAFRLLGATDKLKQAQASETFLAELEVKLKQEISIKYSADEEALANEIKDKLIPLLREAFKQSLKEAADELSRDQAKQKLEKFLNDRAAH